jgi:hypothetical protein
MTDRLLPVTCWCERGEVTVPVSWITQGRTGTCGHPECREGCQPAPENDEDDTPIREKRTRIVFRINTYTPGSDSTPGLQQEADRTGEVHLASRPGQCSCGCGSDLPDGKRKRPTLFLQGHDQRLKGILSRAEAAGAPIRWICPGQDQTFESAAEFAARFSTANLDWPEYVRSSAFRLLAKDKSRRKPDPEPTPVHGVKVGRWTYDGQQEPDGTLTLSTKSGPRRAVRTESGTVRWVA